MTQEDILSELTDECGRAVSMESPLEELGDSLELMSAVLLLETKTGLFFPRQGLSRTLSVGDLVDFFAEVPCLK